MLKGLIGRRVSERVPFGAELNIKFEVEGKEPILAVAANISPGGLQFTVAKGKIKLQPEDAIELLFQLPKKGDTIINGEICYFSNTSDAFNNPQVCYGVKFLNLDLDTWNSINEYCLNRQKIDPAQPSVTPAATAAKTAPADKPEVTQSLNQDTIDQILKTLKPKTTTSQQPNQVTPSVASTSSAAAMGTAPIPTNTVTPTPVIPEFAGSNLNINQPIPTPAISIETSGSLKPANPGATDPARSNLTNNTPNPFIQTNMIDMVFNSQIDLKGSSTPNATQSNPNLASVTPPIPSSPSTSASAAIAGSPQGPAGPSVPEIPVTPSPEALIQPKFTNLSPQLTQDEILALRQVDANTSGQKIAPTGQSMVEPAKPGPVQQQPSSGQPMFAGNATPIFKSNSMASMDQSMIDQMIRNLNRNQPSPQSASPATGTTGSGVVNAVVRLKNLETINAVIEKLDFGGLLVRLPKQLAINTSLAIDISSPDPQPLTLNGTVTNCDQIANTNEYLVGIFFDNLTHLQIDRLQSLVNKPR